MRKNAKEEDISIFRRNESSCWYYTIKDPRTGAWKKKSTKETSYAKALEIARAERAATERFLGVITLDALLELYSNPETNPRYLDAQEMDRRYGYGHACHIASSAKDIRSALHRQPKLLNTPITRITTQDILTIRSIIVRAYGKTGKSQHLFSHFKTFFSREYEMGILPSNPASKVPNISYEAKERIALSEEAVKKLVAIRDICPSKVQWAYVIIIAATGLRRSEILALTPNATKDNIIDVSAAYKWLGDKKYGIGKPKCDSFRKIAMPKIVSYALSLLPQPSSPSERYFPFDQTWSDKAIQTIRILAASRFPEYAKEYEEMTAHVLRHTLTTLFVVNGAQRELIEVWMGWKRTLAGTMLDNYSHPSGEQMRSLANMVDEMLLPDDFLENLI